MGSLPQLAVMLVREWLSRETLQRRPEPTAAMGDPGSVEAFHTQGSVTGPLLPVYHFNALGASHLIPEGGLVLDLGSGSGQYLAYLAARRPDIRIIGLDLSPVMVSVGERFIDGNGLRDRVQIRLGDMTDFASIVAEKVAMVSCVFACHHLPTQTLLEQCIAAIGTLRARHGCAIWIFDHARPRHPSTAEMFPEIFTPDAPEEFRMDSRNSLIASFSFAELSRCLEVPALAGTEHHCARYMPLYQVHTLAHRNGTQAGHRCWRPANLPQGALREFRGLKALFPRVALD